MSTHNLTHTPAAGVAVLLILSSCSSGYTALGTHTAEVLINGENIGKRLPVRCEQVQWNWQISTLEDTPGFVAQLQTGDAVIARGLQIEQLGGFTGSFWDGNVGNATASINDGTVQMRGTAEGYYHRDPAEEATANFLIRTDC
jgi:hypothetical protein